MTQENQTMSDPSTIAPEFGPDLSDPVRWQPILVQTEDDKFGWLQPIQGIFGGGWYVTAWLSPEWNQPAMPMDTAAIGRWAASAVDGIPEFVKAWWSQAAAAAEAWEAENPGLN